MITVSPGTIILTPVKKLTIWERLLFDDPLNPPPRKPESYTVTNVNDWNTLTFSFDTETAASNGAITIVYGGVGATSFIPGRGQYSIGISPTMTEMRLERMTHRMLNPPPFPVPRNRQDQRILRCLGKDVPNAVKRAEKRLGRRDHAVSFVEWDAYFFDLLLRRKQLSQGERARKRSDKTTFRSC